MFTIEELKEKIVENYDPDLLVDVLEVTTEELVEALSDGPDSRDGRLL
jgi:hypothetical protein